MLRSYLAVKYFAKYPKPPSRKQNIGIVGLMSRPAKCNQCHVKKNLAKIFLILCRCTTKKILLLIAFLGFSLKVWHVSNTNTQLHYASPLFTLQATAATASTTESQHELSAIFSPQASTTWSGSISSLNG